MFGPLLDRLIVHDSRTLRRFAAVIRAVFYLTCVNVLVLFFMQGGYDVTLGPLHLHAYSLRNWLLLCFALGLAKTCMEGSQEGRTVSESLQSPFLLFLGAVTVYYANGHTFETADTLPARHLPVSLLIDRDFYLDEFVGTITRYDDPYFARPINGHWVSVYPPWGAVLSLPVYLIPVLQGVANLTAESFFDLEKRAAVLITALSVLVLLLALRRLTSPKIAWCIAVVYAFGTSSLSLSSQAMWQHGQSQLFLSLTLYCLVRGLEMPMFLSLAGLPLGVAVICRPLNIVMALPIALYMLHKHRDRFVGFVLCGIPPLLLFMAYNATHFGSPFVTGFSSTVMSPSSLLDRQLSWFKTPLREGLVGVLFSPARGLFIYSPIFLCSVAGMVVAWRDRQEVLLKYLSLAPLLLLVPVSLLGSWWGGHGYGPRLLADSTPILCLLLYPIFERIPERRWLKPVVVGLAVLSISMHTIGFATTTNWDSDILDFDEHPERVWYWRESPPMLLGLQLAMRAWQRLAAVM